MAKCSKCSKMMEKEVSRDEKLSKVTTHKGKGKVEKVMKEFKKDELHSGSKKGPLVKNPKQAIAIALSEGRKAQKRRKK